MARAKKQESSGLLAGLILVVIVVAATAMSLLAISSSLILIGVFVYSYSCLKEMGQFESKKYSDFANTSDELSSIDEMIDNINIVENINRDLGIKKDRLSVDKEAFIKVGSESNIRLRNDGMFDNRIAMGQQLNLLIEEKASNIQAVGNEISICNHRINGLKEQIDKIKRLPDLRRKEYSEYVSDWNSSKALSLASKYSIMVYFVALILLLTNAPGWVIQLSMWINKHSLIPVIFNSESLYGCMLVSFFISLVIMFVTFIYMSSRPPKENDSEKSQISISNTTDVRTKNKTIYLLLCWTLIPSLVALIEGVLMMKMTDDKFTSKYCSE